ncbi:MAG TPA: AI-2E family transporter [Paracoccus sp.]|nr:AI-2E family transporter [Paracoccus sp. (in: a-proteobacteria)]
MQGQTDDTRSPDPHPPRRRVPVWHQVLIWISVLLAFLIAMWLLSGILLPFLVGAGVAYFLDPLVGRLHRWGMPRVLAAGLTIALLLGLIVLGLVLILPILLTEAAALWRELPDLIERARWTLDREIANAENAGGESALRQVVANAGEALRENFQTLVAGVFYGVSGLVRLVLFWVVMPVVAFYLLIDWPRVVQNVDELLPREHALTIRQIARDIDAAIAGFVRGEVMVSTILAGYYGLAFTLAGLSYGLFVGVVTGLVSFIPYVGAFIGGTLAIGLALYQFWGDLWMIGIVTALFFFGQFLESQVLVPNLVGNSVNLHPVWLIFSVMAFGVLFGLAGAIVAVPVAAAIGVLARFALARYLQSALYRGDMRIHIE